MRSPGAFLAALLLSGCAVGPDYVSPEFDLPPRLGDAQAEAIDQSPEQKWWAGFGDPFLNDLVEQALENNLEIGIALARVAEAQSLVRAARSDFFPILDGTANGNVQRTDFAGTQTGASAGPVFSLILDIAGGLRRRLEQSQALAEVEVVALADVRRLTVGAVASTYVELRRNEAQLGLLDRSLELQQQTLEIVRQRRSAGLSSDLDVQRAAADLAITRSQRGFLAANRTQAANALAVLLGRPTGTITMAPTEEDVSVPVFEGEPPKSLPAAIVRNRPDVRFAEAQLKASTAAIGIEQADLYPALRLPGQVSASVGGTQFLAGSLSAGLSAVLDIPLLDAGRRRAEVRAARARAQNARLTYELSVLSALQEIEDAFADIEGILEQRASILVAIEASERAFNQLNALYREGLATFIDILDGQRTLISSREGFVEVEADLADAIITLYVAAGSIDPGSVSDTP